MIRPISTILAGLVLFAGCRSEPPPPPNFDPVSRAEAEAMGKRFADLLNTCNASELAPLWNAEVTVARALKDSKASSSVKDGLRSVFTSQRLWIGQCQSLTAAGESKNSFLGVREQEGRHQPLIRMLGENGLNYVELELGRFDGEIQAVDATYYLTGEPFSRTMSRMIGSAQSALDDGAISDGTLMMRIAERQRAGDAEGALALIKELPPQLRQDKAVMLLEIGLDPADDDQRYLAAIERFEKAYPNDPALALVSIDGFFMREEWDLLIEAIESLDQRVKDPYLQVMRAVAYLGADKLDRALKHIDLAIEREPDLEDAWDTRANICLKKKDFACAVKSLKVLAEKFDFVITDDGVTQLENGDALLASEPYKEWRATTDGSD